MFDNLEESLKEHLINSLDFLKERGIEEFTSAALILMFIINDETLFKNIFPDITIDEILKGIYQLEQVNNDLPRILEESEKIAKKHGDKIIYDEYLLYAILSLDCDALKVLKILDINIEIIKDNIKEYMGEENSFLTNLTKEALNNRLNPYIGRDEYIEKVIRILSKKNKNNCLLIGSAGVGKSALVEGVAMKLANINSPYIIYRLDLGAIVAGTRYRGDLEERLIEVLNKVKNNNSILFIDEIHTIINSGNSEGSLDIANILKPALARNEIKCIGATTTNEYYKYIEKDEALARRFQKIFISEATEKETYKILKGIVTSYSDFYKLSIKNDVLNEIISKGKMYPNRYFPDKAIDILDESCALAGRRKSNRLEITDINRIVFENLGIMNLNKIKEIKSKLNYQNLYKYYKIFSLNLDIRKTILNVLMAENDIEYLLNDLSNVFNITGESVLFVSNIYSEEEDILSHVLKFPISVLVIEYAKNIDKEFYNMYIKTSNYRKISFKITIIIYYQNKENIGMNNLGFLKAKENDRYIDELLSSLKLENIKILKLQNLLRKRNCNILISNEINDAYLEEINKIVEENIEIILSGKTTITKNDYNELMLLEDKK